MRWVLLFAALGCSSSNRTQLGVGAGQIETDLPIAPALSNGTASAMVVGDQLIITVDNVQDTRNACEPATFPNVVDLVEVKITMPNAGSGTYDDLATATMRVLGSGCDETFSATSTSTLVSLDVDGSMFVGVAKVTVLTASSSSTTIVSFHAPTCAPSGTDSACILLPACSPTTQICMH